MNCLVLGGNGFIGSHLVDRLVAEGHRVRVFDKYEEHYRSPLSGVEYRFGDFGNRGLVSDTLRDIDVVFHLISTTLPKTSNDDPAFDVQSNVVDSIYLLEQCAERKIKKIIFTSSGGTVYGTPDMLPIREDSATNPVCSYGITKLTIEKYLVLFHYLYGLEYAVVRPSNPYGSRQNPFGIQGVIPVFLAKAVKKEPIEIWGDGSVMRDYIFIDDLVGGMYSAMTKNASSRVFNLGSGEGKTLNEIVSVIRTIARMDVEVIYKPKRTFDVPRIYLDISRAHTQLDWRPVTSLEDGIRKTFEFVKGVCK